MWPYFGSKLLLSEIYPKPKYNLIIEPFAGTAKYSLKYFENDVVLVDSYDVIIRIWAWLQKCSKKDVLSLPKLKMGQSVNDFSWDCDESRWLVGFLIGRGSGRPRKRPTKWSATDGQRPNSQSYQLELISKNLYKIKHWKFVLGDYQCICNSSATWFIDPPYYIAGNVYKNGSRKIDYEYLGYWCKSRNGQVIVCEGSDAKWLDFTPIPSIKGIGKERKSELVWING